MENISISHALFILIQENYILMFGYNFNIKIFWNPNCTSQAHSLTKPAHVFYKVIKTIEWFIFLKRLL
jgi:hypothetical protein